MVAEVGMLFLYSWLTLIQKTNFKNPCKIHATKYSQIKQSTKQTAPIQKPESLIKINL